MGNAWDGCASPATDLRLHPALLDVAAGLGLQEPGLAPAGCATVSFAGTLPADPLAHVTRRATASGVEIDLRLADRETGRVAAVLLGLRFTRMAGIEPPARIAPAVPAWRPSPLDAGDPGGPVVVIGEGELAGKIAAYLDAAGRLAARRRQRRYRRRHGRPHRRHGRAGYRLRAGRRPRYGHPRRAAIRGVLAALRHPTRLLGVGQGAFSTGAGPLDPFQALTYGVVATAALEEAHADRALCRCRRL